MNRVFTISCRVQRERYDALNRESGQFYTLALTWHWRFYRRSGHWMSNYDMQRFIDSRLTTKHLHAHSVDAAIDGFYDACKTARQLKKEGIDAKFPYHLKESRTTTWKSSAIKVKNDHVTLSCGNKRKKIVITLPKENMSFPIKQVELVYDEASRKYNWHVCIENGQKIGTPTGD